jgi:hypothetical protein
MPDHGIQAPLSCLLCEDRIKATKGRNRATAAAAVAATAALLLMMMTNNNIHQ